jgi:small subunit ribosomal protein S25e
MPGKKSLKKQEKQQAAKDKEAAKTKERREKIIGSIDIPDSNSDEVMSALHKMKAITSTGVASQFNLKISVANKMLRDLEKEGILTLAAKSHNLKVYAIPQD